MGEYKLSDPSVHICIYIIIYEIAAPRRNDPNAPKLGKCVDQCTTNNWLHFQTDGVHIGPTVTSLVSPAISVLYLAESVQSFQTKFKRES